MDSVHIRPARPDDDVAIGELLIASFLAGYARKLPEVTYGDARRTDLRAVAKKREVAAVWVATLEDRIVGTVALYPPGAEGSEAWLPNAADLRHLATAPELHGRGLSVPLLEAAEAHARALKVDAICLHVRRGADGVARMYERRGWVRDVTGDRDLLPDVFLEAYVRRL